MKKKAVFVFAVLLILVGLFVIIKVASNVLFPIGNGALQVTSNIKSEVFLDGKSIGTTPVCKCEQNERVRQGEHVVKIAPSDKSQTSYTTKVNVQAGVMTVIERTFLPGSYASSYILTLEKTNSNDAQLFVASIPDAALISLDGNAIGVSPLLQRNISASEHELEIQKQGFGKKTIRVRAVPSYKLVVNIMLGTEPDKEDEVNQPQITPSPTTNTTPIPVNKIKVRSTPTGFLNVRENANTNSKKLGEVKPEETYEYLEEKAGWFQIKMTDGKLGWINGTYAEKLTQ